MTRLFACLICSMLIGTTASVAVAKEPAAVTATVAELSLKQLVAEPKRYAGQTVSVTARYAGMCSDGADFYFKDRLTTIEVYLPADGMPDNLKIGTLLQVRGEVKVRENSNGEADVRIKPTTVTVAAK